MTLMILLVIGIIASTLYRTHQLHLKVAANEQLRVAAIQHALAGVDRIMGDAENFATAHHLPEPRCTSILAFSVCGDSSLELKPNRPGDENLYAMIRGPLVLPGGMSRSVISAATSAVHFNTTKFEIEVAYRGATAAEGRAHIVQGVAVRQPISSQQLGPLR